MIKVAKDLIAQGLTGIEVVSEEFWGTCSQGQGEVVVKLVRLVFGEVELTEELDVNIVNSLVRYF